MKKLFLSFLLVTSISYPYDQLTHVYITHRAYELLVYYLGHDIPELQSYLGTQVGGYPFAAGNIVSGVWREDCEDIIYEYSKDNPPTLTGFGGTIYQFVSSWDGGIDPFVSSTHFWYSDDGDNVKSTINAGIRWAGINFVTSFTVENAFQKLARFNNDFLLAVYPNMLEEQESYPGMRFGFAQCLNFMEFYRTGEVKLFSWMQDSVHMHPYPSPIVHLTWSEEFIVMKS